MKSPFTIAPLVLSCSQRCPRQRGRSRSRYPRRSLKASGASSATPRINFFPSPKRCPPRSIGTFPTRRGGDFKGVRSFAEQVKHVACANYAFFNEIEGKTPPDLCEKGGPSTAKTKDELVKYLRDSFEYGNKVLATINEKNAMDRVDGRYGGPDTTLGIAVIAVWHITDHYGQIVYYLRLNGIVPPPTQQHGLAVR